MRPWLGLEHSLAALNQAAEQRNLQTESGKPVRFVAPGTKDAYYELKVFETGRVETRADSLHDYLNALAWLAFPRSKARINALHAAEIPREGGQRGRLRDLLTIFDEGGAIVQCDEEPLVDLLTSFRWKTLFWEKREQVKKAMRIVVFGHAVLEKAIEPWPGVTCKAIVIPRSEDVDLATHHWLDTLKGDASPRDLAPVPVFGYPGWAAQDEAFYDDERYFRPLRHKA